MLRIDPAALAPDTIGSDYPARYDAPVDGRVVRDLARAGGAADWIANHVVVAPGGWSSQRHWDAGGDEIVVIFAGTGISVDDNRRTPMHAGNVAIFPKNDGKGHHLVTESAADLVLLALSAPEASRVTHPNIDLVWDPDHGQTHRDGSPY